MHTFLATGNGQGPRTFAQHAAQGELLLRDKHILQSVLKLIADAQAVHCSRRQEGEGACGSPSKC